MARPKGPLNPERTRQAVLEAATRAFAANGFADTSLPKVAAAVGISAPTLLYHFGSKEQLLDEVLRAAWRQVSADLLPKLELAQTPEDALGAALESMFAAEAATGTLHAQISAAVIGQRGIGRKAIDDTLMPLLDAVVDAMVTAPVNPVGPPDRAKALVVYVLVAHASGYLLDDRVPDDVAALRKHEVEFALVLLNAIRV